MNEDVVRVARTDIARTARAAVPESRGVGHSACL